MTRAHLREAVTEAIILTGSAAFLACYIVAKIAVLPWGSFRF